MFSRFIYFKNSACAHGLINTVSQISFSLVSKRTEIFISSLLLGSGLLLFSFHL